MSRAPTPKPKKRHRFESMAQDAPCFNTPLIRLVKLADAIAAHASELALGIWGCLTLLRLRSASAPSNEAISDVFNFFLGSFGFFIASKVYLIARGPRKADRGAYKEVSKQLMSQWLTWDQRERCDVLFHLVSGSEDALRLGLLAPLFASENVAFKEVAFLTLFRLVLREGRGDFFNLLYARLSEVQKDDMFLCFCDHYSEMLQSYKYGNTVDYYKRVTDLFFMVSQEVSCKDRVQSVQKDLFEQHISYLEALIKCDARDRANRFVCFLLSAVLMAPDRVSKDRDDYFNKILNKYAEYLGVDRSQALFALYLSAKGMTTNINVILSDAVNKVNEEDFAKFLKIFINNVFRQDIQYHLEPFYTLVRCPINKDRLRAFKKALFFSDMADDVDTTYDNTLKIRIVAILICTLHPEASQSKTGCLFQNAYYFEEEVHQILEMFEFLPALEAERMALCLQLEKFGMQGGKLQYLKSLINTSNGENLMDVIVC